jgi:hypothetical protein
MRQGSRFVYDQNYEPKKDPSPPASPRVYKFTESISSVSQENLSCRAFKPSLIVRERPSLGKTPAVQSLLVGKTVETDPESHLTTKAKPLKPTQILNKQPAKPEPTKLKTTLFQRTKPAKKSKKREVVKQVLTPESSEAQSPKKTVTWSDRVNDSESEAGEQVSEEVSMSPRYSEDSEVPGPQDRYDELEDMIQQQRSELMSEGLLRSSSREQTAHKTLEELEQEIISTKNLLAREEEYWSESEGAPESDLSYSIEESVDERMSPRLI